MISIKRIVLYLFPIYLVLVEFAIRFALGAGRTAGAQLSLSGSTSSVSAAGLSLVASALIPKPMTFDPATQSIIDATGITALRPGDGAMIGAAFATLLLAPFAWGWALYMIHDKVTDYDLAIGGLQLSGPFWVAIAIYFVGIIFTELKERV